jgi:L-fucose isomerase-like protein
MVTLNGTYFHRAEKMTKNTTIAALPVGELETDRIKDEVAALLRAFDGLDCDLFTVAPASDVESARQSVRELSHRNPDLLVIVPLRGLSAETIEAAARASPAPCLILPVRGRYALPSSALAVGALRQSKLPVELLHAPPDDPEFLRRLSHVVRAAKACSRIRKSRIGVIGGLFPNLVACRYDANMLASRLGVTLLPIPFEDVRNAVKSSARRLEQVAQTKAEISAAFKIDPADENALVSGLRLHLALKRIVQEQKLDGFAAECWSGFPRELGLNPCLGFVEDAYTLACEGDVLLGIALLAVRELTGRSAYVGDLYELDMDGVLTLIHCGGPASLARDRKDVVVGKSRVALERDFETLTCRPRLEPGPVTLVRFYGAGCDRLHLASGELTGSEQSPTLDVKIRIEANRWDFLEQCFGNHYVVAAGDIRDELKLLCKWLDISVFET